MSNASAPAAATEPDAAQDADEDEGIDVLPGQHWANLQQNDDGGDVDSMLEAEVQSTTSLRASILQYRNIAGRTYHADVGEAEYWGPNDYRAQEGLDIHHHTCLLLLDQKLYLSPLPEGIQKVLDIGTGTGIWAIDFADEVPSAEVIGTDVSPIQPSWVPPNLKFEIDDCTRRWTWAENSIDFIHMRWLVGSIANWTALFKEAYRALRPGGYLESHEPSSGFENEGEPLDESSALSQWGKIFVTGGIKLGRSFTVFQDQVQRKAMEEAGFVEIGEREIKNPVGPWPKDIRLREIGLYSEATFLEDPKGYITYFAHTLEWTNDEIEMFLMEFRRELKTRKFRPFYRHKVVWGRKPLR